MPEKIHNTKEGVDAGCPLDNDAIGTLDHALLPVDLRFGIEPIGPIEKKMAGIMTAVPPGSHEWWVYLRYNGNAAVAAGTGTMDIVNGRVKHLVKQIVARDL